jgi:ribosome-associated translation inhibitor RaiA
MDVQFHSPDPESAGLRDRAMHRLRQVLRSLSAHVRYVQIELEEVPGPRPGVDKRCQVRAQLNTGTVARVEVTARDRLQAIEMALARLPRRVLTQLQALRSTPAETRLAPAPARRAPVVRRVAPTARPSRA